MVDDLRDNLGRQCDEAWCWRLEGARQSFRCCVAAQVRWFCPGLTTHTPVAFVGFLRRHREGRFEGQEESVVGPDCRPRRIYYTDQAGLLLASREQYLM